MRAKQRTESREVQEFSQSVERLEALLGTIAQSSGSERASVDAKPQAPEHLNTPDVTPEEERQYVEPFDVMHARARDRFPQSRRSTFSRVAFVLLITAAAAVWAVGNQKHWFDDQRGPSTAGTAKSSPATSNPVAVTAPAPKLVLTQSRPLGSGEELPLGLSVQGGSDGMGIAVSGLMPGATLTAGRASGPSGWWLGLADLDRAKVKRPPGYVGTMHLTVELHLANGSIADKQSLPIDWTAPPHIGATVVKPEPVGAAPARATIDRMRGDEVPVNAAGSLDAEAIAALIRRADAFVELGDISAARVLLRRAAESRDPRAALALGATYDPTALAKRGVQGLVGDVTTASIWYNLAKQLGSEEAQARIDQLASQRR